MYCKRNNLEIGTHAPMMIHIPGVTDHGIETRQLVEFVDLFPTLVEAAGLPQLPRCPKPHSTHLDPPSTCREGMSLLPLIENPNTNHWKKYAFSQFRKGTKGQKIMGYSIRQNRYRYIEWFDFNIPLDKTDFHSSVASELYDHEKDPDEIENLANDEKYAKIKKKLAAVIHQGWWEVQETR